MLVLVPPGRDDEVAVRVLEDAGLPASLCANLDALVAGIGEGAAAVLVAEEMLGDPGHDPLQAAIAAQPPWSDLPVLLLSPFRGKGVEDRWALRALGNVTVLERPVRLAALLTAVRSAVRARQRQFELREHLRLLQESRARERERAADLESLLGAVPAAIWISNDRECREIKGNGISYDWLHLRGGNVSAVAADAPERGFTEYRDDRPVAAHDLPMQRAAASGRPVLGEELELRFNDGSRRHILGNAVPLLDEAGAPRGALAAFVDVSALKTAETAARRQADRLRLLAEAASVVLTTEDAPAMIERLFHSMAEHVALDTYFSFEVVKGERRLHLKSWSGVPEDKVAEIAELDFGVAVCGRVAESGRMILVNDVQSGQNPAAEWVRRLGLAVYVSFPLLAEGELLGTLSFGSRTKSRFDAEEIEFLSTLCHYVTVALERVRLIRSLRDADRRKDEFIAMLAHELRNPLAPIRQAAAVARMPSAGPAQLGWCHAVIERQVNHMAALLDDLLDVSRISRGRLQLHCAPVPLAEVVSTAIETAWPHLDTRGHHFEVRLVDQPVTLFGDRLRLAQVLANLLNNAAKYTARGGRVRLSAHCEGGWVQVVVADNGIGIPPEQLERMFEMFTQGNAPGDLSEHGLGIGLNLARSLVAMHGGTLEASSEGVGQGARFVVRLPVAAAVDARPGPPAAMPAADNSGRRVLVVDDNVDAAESLAMLLRLQGHVADTAHDGEAALRAVASADPEVVFLDLGMPGMDGYEVATRLRMQRDASRLTLVALTGWGQADDRRRTRAAGFDHHLTKPVNLDALERILQQRLHEDRAAS